MIFEKIKATEIDKNVFTLLDKDWLLLTAGDEKAHNTMTISWGGLGVLWNKPVVNAYVRPQRYTYEFTEKHDYFTLSAYPESMRKTLSLCGSKSGRDIDKAKECGLTPVFDERGTVYYEEAELVLICKKAYFSDIDSKNFLVDYIQPYYQKNDYHRMYIAEIVEVLIKK